MTTIDEHVTADTNAAVFNDDDNFQTPPSSRYQSFNSLATSVRSVYFDSCEHPESAHMETRGVEEGTRGSWRNSAEYSSSGNDEKDEVEDEDEDEDGDVEKEEEEDYADTARLTVEETRTRVEPEVSLTDCCCLLCDLHHRAKYVVESKWPYLVSALKCSDLNCPNYNDLTRDDLLLWLDHHKDGEECSKFVPKCFRGTKPWANAIQKEQSQIFFFFYMLMRDIQHVSSTEIRQGFKHETYPHHDSFLNWMHECELILDTLLQTSYTHGNTSKTNLQTIEKPLLILVDIKKSHEQKDYIGISFEDSGFDQALADIKRLRRKLAGTPTTTQKVMASVAILVFIADIGTDLFQMLTYKQEGKMVWLVILFFIIAPSLMSSIICFAQIYREKTETKADKNLKRLGLVMVSLQLGHVWRSICEICDRYPIVDSYIVLNLLLIKMIEGLLEGGPQALVQTYVLLDEKIDVFDFSNCLKVISPFVSSISMAAALADLDLGRAAYCIPVMARLLSVLCRLGEVLCRFVAYAVCLYAFQWYGLLLFAVQFVVITIPTYIALRKDHTDNRSQDVNCVYLRCRYGGFYQEKPRKLFTHNVPRLIVWFCVTSVYSFVPIQRFELDMEFNLTQSVRLPFWKCSRSYGLYNVIYGIHQTFNVVAFTLWVTLGGGTSHRFFIPICAVFIIGTLISGFFRLQSWMTRTYEIVLRPGMGAIG